MAASVGVGAAAPRRGVTEPESTTRRPGDASTAVALAFVAVVASFFASNLVIQWSSEALTHRADTIIQHTVHIEQLSRIRKSVLEAELSLSHAIENPMPLPTSAARLDAAMSEVDTNTRAYLALATTAEEHALTLEIHEAWIQFATAVTTARQLNPSKHEEVRVAFIEKVEPARARMMSAAASIIEHDTLAGRTAATDIQRIRARTTRLADSLHILCGLLAAALAALLHRQARTRRAIADAYVHAVEDRAAELEQFAGRVAHDIRGPLSAAQLSAEMMSRKSAEDGTRELSARMMSSLARAGAITSALLDFARAGAKPDPGARTEAAAILHDVAADVADLAARSRIEVRVDAKSDAFVACSTGAYVSIVSNLMRNAIKYMGDVEVRRITARLVVEPTIVRTEIVDTGPGIAKDIQGMLFEPYFRGARGPEGLGLGLATVKKLVEGHGGRVGIDSTLGEGSTFWFELPRA